MTTEGIVLAEAFPRIRNAKWRRRILNLVQSMAEGEYSAEHKAKRG
jgi:hypothetical protein